MLLQQRNEFLFKCHFPVVQFLILNVPHHRAGSQVRGFRILHLSESEGACVRRAPRRGVRMGGVFALNAILMEREWENLKRKEAFSAFKMSEFGGWPRLDGSRVLHQKVCPTLSRKLALVLQLSRKGGSDNLRSVALRAGLGQRGMLFV
jgi:hypothetical protein